MILTILSTHAQESEERTSVPPPALAPPPAGTSLPQPESGPVIPELPGIDFAYISAVQGVKYSIPAVTYLFSNVNAIPGLAENMDAGIHKSLHQIPSLFYTTYQLLGASAGGYGPPIPGTGQSVVIKTTADLAEFFKHPEVSLINESAWNMLPFDFQKGIVEWLNAARQANRYLAEFSVPIINTVGCDDSVSLENIQHILMLPWTRRELNDLTAIETIAHADIKRLSHATRILSDKLQWFFAQSGSDIPDEFTHCMIRSGLGDLLISGSQNDTVQGGYFCVIELGGDDVYYGHTAAPLSSHQHLGVVIDMMGNDQYLCEDAYLAAGILGFGALIDMDGDDIYRTNQPGLAFSLYGSSLVYDRSGDDEYVTESPHSQSAACLGASLFMDIAGNDEYHSRSNSQAFGGTQGIAVFFDKQGDDNYNAGKVGTAYTQSFVQGSARGRWAEATDGQSLAGGMGIFIDHGGTDRYSAGSFSQGASYYFGLGMFFDREGDDHYDALSHSQGYAAHYSLASFVDKRGNDHYNFKVDHSRLTQIIGSGRDFSAGLFLDWSGDDSYSFGNRSAGIGDLQGIGLFCDMQGDDQYYWHKNQVNANTPSMGKTVGLDAGMGISVRLLPVMEKPNTGLFMDSHGKDEINFP